MTAIFINGQTYKRIHVVRHVDSNAGFCALITYALNGVRLALRDDSIAVIHFDEHKSNYFYDPSRGDNVWEYYFEPVMGLSSGELQSRLNDGTFSTSQVHSYLDAEVRYWHQRDPDRIATFWAFAAPQNRALWMAEKRALGRDYVKRFLRVKQQVLTKVDTFADRFQGKYTLGVHVRGTDFAYA